MSRNRPKFCVFKPKKYTTAGGGGGDYYQLWFGRTRQHLVKWWSLMIVIERSPPPGRMLRTLGSGLLRANSAHGPSFAAQWTCHDIWEFTWLEKDTMWYSDTKCWNICDKKIGNFRTKMQPYSFLQWLEMCSKMFSWPMCEFILKITAGGTHYSL